MHIGKKSVFVLIFLFVYFSIQFTLNFTHQKDAPIKKEILGGEVQNAIVTRVIDGDTIEVKINNKEEKVRIIGINTPETVDRRRTVECFGIEASKKAKELLSEKSIVLEADPTQANRDKYARLLRYVYFSKNIDFGLKMIEMGYAYEYTYDLPYKKQKEYKEAQKSAELNKLGLWGVKKC